MTGHTEMDSSHNLSPVPLKGRSLRSCDQRVEVNSMSSPRGSPTGVLREGTNRHADQPSQSGAALTGEAVSKW
jgi:hypothetical protein